VKITGSSRPGAEEENARARAARKRDDDDDTSSSDFNPHYHKDTSHKYDNGAHKSFASAKGLLSWDDAGGSRGSSKVGSRTGSKQRGGKSRSPNDISGYDRGGNSNQLPQYAGTFPASPTTYYQDDLTAPIGRSDPPRAVFQRKRSITREDFEREMEVRNHREHERAATAQKSHRQMNVG
jgi:hypothetical protein